MPEESPILATIAAAESEGLPPAAVEHRVWARHGKTCAMMALDSSGMTRTSRQLGIVHFLARYMRMRDIACECLERGGCTAWRCFADNLFAEFRDPNAALRVALEIHRRLREPGLMLTGAEPYRVCIGIGYGRVLDDGRFGVMGDEMNLVAKLAEDVAEGGETLLTDAAHGELDEKIRANCDSLRRTISQVDVRYHRIRR